MSPSRSRSPRGRTKSKDFAETPQQLSPASPTSRHSDSSDSTATNSSDEFDWNDGEDNAGNSGTDPKKARRIRRLWLLFLKLALPLRIILVGLLGTGVLIAPWLVFFFRFRDSVAYKQVQAWSIWLAITWLAGALTALVVNGLPRLIITLVFFVSGNAERVKTYVELFMAVSGWIKLALDVSWLWVALSVMRSILDPPGSYWTYVNRAVTAIFSAAIILLAEKLFLQYVAIHFHQKALADRLLENRLALRALDKLSVAPAQSTKQAAKKRREQQKKRPMSSRASSTDLLNTTLSPASRPASAAGSYNEKEKKPRTTTAQRNHKKKKLLAASLVDQLGDAFGQIALKDSKFNREGEIGSLYSARQLARQLFESLQTDTPPRSHLVVEDFYPYFRDHEDAKTAFFLFDKDGNGDLTKKEMREAVQRIYRERKSLTASLNDMSSAVAKLDGVLMAIAILAIGFLCLLIFNKSNTVESLVPLATIVLGFSFIFGHSAQTLFESLIFQFSTHPFDVGDLIINDQPLFVKEFGLFSTVFTRVDGQEIIAPNSLLASSKLIHNVRRSNSMWETTKLMVAYNTPLQTIEALKTKLRAYMADNNREWGSPGCEVNIDKMDFQTDIQLVVAIEHRANWQDWGGRWDRRTKFMRHLKLSLEELNIGYQMPVQPVAFHPASVAPPSFDGMRETFGNAGNVGGSPGRGQAPPVVTVNAGRY